MRQAAEHRSAASGPAPKERVPEGSIVVVGGYGAVGRVVCVQLAERFPGRRVFAAGRNPDRAGAFSRETGGRVLPLKLDLADPSGAALFLEGAGVVVACTEAGDVEGHVAFARRVIEGGAHYVDVSASDARLRELEGLGALARHHGATAVLSVGLSPGLTNLLAKHCVDALGDEPRNLNVSVLLGLGEAHGEAAVRWTIENLGGRFEAPGAGEVGSLTDPRMTTFPVHHGARACYRFDFADQHVLARTLGAEKVATRLCFDPYAATRLLALAKRAGVLRALKSPRVREVLVALFSRFHLGSDGFAVTVEAEGRDRRAYSCSAWGRGEGRATGIVAALVAERLLAPPTLERGVFHIEQLFDPQEIFADVGGHGISCALGRSAGSTGVLQKGMRDEAAERPVWTVDVVDAVLLTRTAFETARGGETVG